MHDRALGRVEGRGRGHPCLPACQSNRPALAAGSISPRYRLRERSEKTRSVHDWRVAFVPWLPDGNGHCAVTGLVAGKQTDEQSFLLYLTI